MTVHAPPGSHNAGWRYGLTFSAPPGTSIVGFDRHVFGDLVTNFGAPPAWDWEYLEAGTIVGQATSTPFRGRNNLGPFDDDFVDPTPRRLSQLQFWLECQVEQNTAPCQENGSYFSVDRIAVKLDDLTPPRVVSSSGSLLAQSGPLRGQRHLILKLQDSASGLYQVRVDVDGERMSQFPIDDNDGACKPPFVVPVPCKLSATVDVPIDTTRLTDGVHAITVRAFDATGVNAAVVGPVSLLVDNLPDPPPRGTAACPTTNAATVSRHLRKRSVVAGRAASLVGRVTAAQIRLKGARVGIVDNPALALPPRLARIRRHGRFSIRLRPKISTTIQPILVSASGEAKACGRRVKVGVRAAVALRAQPRHLRNGESIRLHGRVSRRNLPAQGKTVAIQARARGASAWTTVTLIRSNPDGRFQFAYRFRRTFQTTTYEFRAVAPRERGYPYLRGWSGSRRVTVSP